MSHDADRERVKDRVERVQARIKRLFGVSGGEEIRLLLETELVQTRVEARDEGRIDGLRTLHQAGHGPAALSPPLRRVVQRNQPGTVDQQASTPVRPVDWVGPRKRV